MKEIKATSSIHGYILCQVDDEDYERVNRYNWCVHGKAHKTISRHTANDAHIPLANEVLQTEGVIDHRDRNPFNNQKENLRKCTQSQNLANNPKPFKNSKSKYKGVHPVNPKCLLPWSAQIQCKRKKLYLGTFATEEEAARTYDIAAKEMFGEFAFLNFP